MFRRLLQERQYVIFFSSSIQPIIRSSPVSSFAPWCPICWGERPSSSVVMGARVGFIYLWAQPAINHYISHLKVLNNQQKKTQGGSVGSHRCPVCWVVLHEYGQIGFTRGRRRRKWRERLFVLSLSLSFFSKTGQLPFKEIILSCIFVQSHAHTNAHKLLICV